MGASKIKGLRADGYTSRPTHLRIYKEDQGPSEWWNLDGADEEGRFTENLWTFPTFRQAVDAMPMLVREAEDDGVTWAWRGVCPHRDCGYGECSGRWVNGACETHGNGEGRCQRDDANIWMPPPLITRSPKKFWGR